MSVLSPPRLLSSHVLGSHQVSVLVVTWQHPFTRKISPVGLLCRKLNGLYTFNYLRQVLSIEGFRPLVGFPDLARTYESTDLFPLFTQRVMDPSRPDYSRFIRALGLSDNPSPWEQISHSGGRRAGDTLQLLPVPAPVEGQQNHWEATLFVHGLRHVAGVSRNLNGEPVLISRDEHDSALRGLEQGHRLLLAAEPDNPYNSNAVMVMDRTERPLGYIPDVFTEDFKTLGLDNLNCQVEVVNGPSAPWHLRLIAKLTCIAPDDFKFFATESWQLLAEA